jgi:hypothetical protein
MIALLPILSERNDRARAVATAVCDLVIKAKQLGEVIQPQWFERLAAAAENGVFERHAPDAIVDRILMTDAPSEVAA